MLRRLAVVVAAAALSLPAAAFAEAVPGTPGTPGAPGLGDPYWPLDGNGGYDARHYALDLSYDPPTDTLRGVATIEARATQDLSSFNLDLDGLTVRSITVGGHAATWTRDGSELTVTPPRTLRGGRRFTTVIAYDGVPHIISDALGLSGFFHTDDGTVVAGEPHVAATWFPVNDHPLDKASYTFRITVPAGLEAIANGVLRSSRTRGGSTTWVWEARQPMAPYLTTATIGEFDVRAYRAGGIRYWDAIDLDLFAGPQPRTGERFALSQAGGPAYKRLSRTVAVPASGGRLSFWVTRDTQAGAGFLFVEARTAGAGDWTTLPDRNGHTDSGTGFVCPLWLALHPFLAHYQTDNGDGTCSPKGTSGTWSAASGKSDGYEVWDVELAPYAGRQVELSITLAGDAPTRSGVFVDDVTLSTGAGTTSFEDDGNTLDGWTVAGPPAGSAANPDDWITGTAADGPPTLGQRAATALRRQPEIIAFLSGVFGPYPFSAAGGIVDDFAGLIFALENQTRPIYPAAYFGYGGPGESVVVHELAHQWTGDDVALAAWPHIWLNEGFATYAQWLWSEHEGRGTAQEIYDIFASFPADAPFWTVRPGDPGPDRLFDDAVYYRGAMTLHALRREIGDGTFFRLLREWTRAHAGGNVTTPEFIALAERMTGRELDAFFDAWLFTPAKPGGLTPARAQLGPPPPVLEAYAARGRGKALRR